MVNIVDENTVLVFEFGRFLIQLSIVSRKLKIFNMEFLVAFLTVQILLVVNDRLVDGIQINGNHTFFGLL